MGLVIRNVADAVESPHPEHREMKTLSESDIHILLEFSRDTEYYPMWYTYLFTAMRRSELLALQWKNVELLGCTISVTRSLEYNHKAPKDERIKFKDTKTAKSRRMISLTPSNALVLKEHMESREKFLKSVDPDFDPKKDFDQNELVFCHPDGKPYLPEGVSHAWIKLVRRCGFKGVRLHDCRHTHATLMLKDGVHPKIVQERLGHASITTTLDTYSHVTEGLQRAAAKSFDSMVIGKNKDRHPKALANR